MHLYYDIPFLILRQLCVLRLYLNCISPFIKKNKLWHWTAFCTHTLLSQTLGVLESSSRESTILLHIIMWESFSFFLLMLFFSIYYWPLLPFFSFCTMAHVFIYCAPHPFRERVFQTPTMRGMIRTGIIFIATQTLSNSALPHIQNKGILKEKSWTIEFRAEIRNLSWLVLVDT